MQLGWHWVTSVARQTHRMSIICESLKFFDSIPCSTMLFGSHASGCSTTKTADPESGASSTGAEHPSSSLATRLIRHLPSLASILLSGAFLKECLDFLFKGIFVHHACMRLGNLSVAVNKQGHGERSESAVSVG